MYEKVKAVIRADTVVLNEEGMIFLNIHNIC